MGQTNLPLSFSSSPSRRSAVDVDILTYHYMTLSAVPTSLLYTSELNELQRKSLVSLFSCGLLGDDGDTLEELMHVIEGHAIAGGEFPTLALFTFTFLACFPDIPPLFSPTLCHRCPTLITRMHGAGSLCLSSSADSLQLAFSRVIGAHTSRTSQHNTVL